MRTRIGLASASFVLAFAACGDSRHGGNPPPPDAGPPPDAAMPDGSTEASALKVDDGVEPVAEWGFEDTPLGARAGVTLFLVNTGTATTDALAMSIGGAGGFAIDAAGSTCSGATLAPGARCRVALAFAPTAAGAHMAQLHVTGAPAALDFPLHGTAIAAAGGLTADTVSLDFGQVEVGQPRQLDVLLSNTGSADVTLSPRTATAGFAITDNCPATLTHGGACTVHVTLAPVRNGIATGTLTVPSSANTVTVGLRGIGARRVTVALGGGGTGRVTSTPPGIDCGTTCTGLFTGPVALTASPDAGNLFSGWGLVCGAQATCALPAQGPSVQITATFQPPTAKRIDITVAGTAPGFVFVAEPDAFSPVLLCTSSCTTYVAPGTDVTLYGFTPSTFAGWTGACAVTTHDCNLGTVIDDRAATVTFDRDEREVATIFPRATVTGLAMTPDGNLVVADAIGVSKLTLTGDVVWTTPIAGAHDLASDAAGRVYGAGGPGLFALSPAGAILWTRSIAVAPNPSQSFQSTVAVSPDGTVIAARTSDGAHVVDGSGADRFTRTGLTADGLAVAPDGTVAIGTESESFPEQLDIVRFDASGAALATLSPLPGDADASLVYDAQSFLCAQTTHGGFAHVSRIAPDLATAFTSSERIDFPIDPPAGIAIDSSGEVVAARGNAETLGIATGLFIEVRSPTGTITWTHSKPSTPQFAIILDDGVTPSAAATDSNHHVAVGGVYNDFMPWIQVYAMP